MSKPKVEATSSHFILPGLATAHSHAFQRALRGRTQRRATAANSFWSWRGLMFMLAETLDPDDIYAIARLAYTELALSGVTLVGEFHYVHHDKDGQPYANRTETAEMCIQAALDVGMRISMIRSGYMRGGFNQDVISGQRRFVDTKVDLILADVESLQAKYADNPLVTVGLSAHSIRAVPLEHVRELSAYADLHQLPFHMHVSEQRRELDESIAEYGLPPVQLLAENQILGSRFVGIHATHLNDAEILALGQSGSTVCICRSTERDLGDGMPDASGLVAAGAKICVGIDSHVEGNAFEEVRAIELDERARLEARHTVAEAPELLETATRRGYIACGMPDVWQEDQLSLSRRDPALVGLDEQYQTDGIIFGASPRAVDKVTVAGKTIIENGQHVDQAATIQAYEATLKKLGLF